MCFGPLIFEDGLIKDSVMCAFCAKDKAKCSGRSLGYDKKGLKKKKLEITGPEVEVSVGSSKVSKMVESGAETKGTRKKRSAAIALDVDDSAGPSKATKAVAGTSAPSIQSSLSIGSLSGLMPPPSITTSSSLVSPSSIISAAFDPNDEFGDLVQGMRQELADHNKAVADFSHLFGRRLDVLEAKFRAIRRGA